MKQLLLAIPLMATFLYAEPERELAFKDAKKEQVRHSMIGPRDTLLFYSLAEQAAVLVVNISSKAPLSATATIHLFAPGTKAEALGKWVNNQHSCGLFPDVPEPILSSKLPEDTCAVTARELVGRENSPQGEDVFADYKVKFTVKEHRVEGKYSLAAFGDEAGVFVKSSAS